MSNRKVPFVTGEFYHIYNRGNDKRKIFHNLEDYKRFIALLYISNSSRNFALRDVSKNIFDFECGETLVSIGSYSLMPNHFHILLTPTRDDLVAKFMQKLTTAYSMYYNIKYNRTGTLFEGRYKSEHTRHDKHLKYLFSYINLNPLKLFDKNFKEKGFKTSEISLKAFKEYEFSSYIDLSSHARKENKIIDLKAFPSYFQFKKDFKK